jgi:hypothetical protein
MDGWEVLDAKREDPAISAIPTIVISGEDPRSTATVSEALLATMGEGLSVNQLVKCVRQISTALLRPD